MPISPHDMPLAGFWLTENITYDPETAALNETGTWTYKPPSQKDIPSTH